MVIIQTLTMIHEVHFACSEVREAHPDCVLHMGGEAYNEICETHPDCALQVGGEASAALQQLGGQLSEAASAAKAALPAPVQQAIDTISPVVNSAVHQVHLLSQESENAHPCHTLPY